MNGKNISRIAVLTTCLGFAATVDAFVGQIAVGLGQMNEIGAIETSFAADAKVETEDMSVNTKIFYKPGMLRDEMKMGGQEMVTIRRFDTNKFWMIMGQGMYMEIDPEAGSEQVQQFRLIEREVIGRETINGMETTKYKSVYETRDGKFGGFTWFTDDNIAVKAFMIHETKGEKQRVRFEITDLRRLKSRPVTRNLIWVISLGCRAPEEWEVWAVQPRRVLRAGRPRPMRSRILPMKSPTPR